MTRWFAPIAAALFLVATGLPASAGAGQRESGGSDTETVERSLTLSPGGTVRLKTFSGRVAITGSPGNQVVIKAVRRASRERLDDIRLEITQTGDTIVIDANHRLVERRNDNVVETDFDIQVPSQVRLDLKTFSAPVTVTGVSGPMEVDGFSSAVRLTEVAGPIRVKTFSGGVTVEARSWADGDGLDVNTFSGDVTLRLPDSARGDLSFDSQSGTFNSELPVTLSSSSRRRFRGALNGGGGTEFQFKTFSGDVDIRR